MLRILGLQKRKVTMQVREKKWKKKYDDNRKYNPRWENDFSWISEASIHKDAFCILCQCSVGPKYSSLKQHEHTKKHKKNAAAETLHRLQNAKTPGKVRNNRNQMEGSQEHGEEERKPEGENGDPNEITETTPLSKDEEEEDELESDRQDEAVVNEKQEVIQFDTSEEFAEIFGSKEEFDSWDEFTGYLEEFQKRTGTYFKPRSACSVDYANERRISGPIPDRFVYANVKMICMNFGTSQKRGTGQRRSYVGKGCGAFMSVSFNKGALRITQSHLIHNNHPPCTDSEQTPQRQLRVFNFTDELDLVIAREVLKANPFEYVNGEKQWITAVERLKNDDRLVNITPRLVKKRIRFLVDKFLAISHGRQPPTEDEMGNILYEFNRSKNEAMDTSSGKGKKKRGPGRPRKRPLSGDEDIEEEDLPSRVSLLKKSAKSSPSSTQSPSTSEMTTLLTYLQKKDEDDRRLRQREIDLRKEELSFQKQRFEFEKMERKAHLDLLKAQLQAFEHGKQLTNVAAKEANQVTEYTIVVDNNNQVLETLPTLG